MQNGITNYFYTIWAKKHPHQLVHNCAFIYNCYSNRAYMHSYCSMCIYYFINFRSHLFLSLFSVHHQWIQFSSPRLLFPQMHTKKHTHTHTQTHPHRQINTEIHKHTHTQTNPHGQTNRETDQSSWVLTGAWLELVGLDRCLTGARLDRCLWNNWSSWVFCLSRAWPRWVLPDRS